jgi:hypothetical protein
MFIKKMTAQWNAQRNCAREVSTCRHVSGSLGAPLGEGRRKVAKSIVQISRMSVKHDTRFSYLLNTQHLSSSDVAITVTLSL